MDGSVSPSSGGRNLYAPQKLETFGVHIFMSGEKNFNKSMAQSLKYS